MRVLYFPEDFSSTEKDTSDITDRGCAIALGFFDGVHLAHRELIGTAISKAQKKDLIPAVFTFPTESEGVKSSSKRIYSTEQKLSIFKNLGVELCFVVRFSAVASLTPDEFIENILISCFGAKEIVCGYNFRFGRGASADSEYLRKRLQALGVRCTVINEYRYHGEPLSSSYIRELLSKGAIQEANEALGAPYFLEGEVSRGDGRGAGLGIPTANLSIKAGGEALRLGVYASAALVDGVLYPAVTNIGLCPTFEERENHSETYLIDKNLELYGKKIKVYLLDFLRDERKFHSKDELIMQINIDKNRASEIYTELKWQELGQN